MRGRKPKPIQQQIVEGDPRCRGKHKLEERLDAQVTALRGLPDPPEHLSDFAKQQWLVWREDLKLMEMDFHADAVVLEGACVNYARAVEADEQLRLGCQVEEAIVNQSTGTRIGTRVKNHPAVAVSNMCWRNVQSLCSDLGLSLISRERLSIEALGEANDELAKILSQPRNDPEGELPLDDPEDETIQ